MSSVSKEIRIRLRSHVACPHCWEKFAPEDTLWVAAHPELTNDPRLGREQQQRFLPTRFNADGNALDIRGLACQELACPRCHLAIPRALLELPPVFASIAGTPSCGKSYFLAAMTWMLRQTLPRDFRLSYTDADPLSNAMLNKYEEDQFLNPNPDEIIKLRKTEEQGDLYDIVRYGEQLVTYPRPFLFTIRPTQQHPSAADTGRVARLLCLYDNAGESFEPGKDTISNPVTRHLAQSHAILFCFDPTQDPRFRRAFHEKTGDYQIDEPRVTARQEIVLHEIVDRVRRHTGLKQSERHRRPLIVVVTKYDAWWPLIGEQRLPDPWRTTGNSSLCCFDTNLLEAASNATRDLLAKVTPELVAAAQEFSQKTWFIPVSATGASPEPHPTIKDPKDPNKPLMGVRPRNMNPMWCEVPLLAALSSVTSGLVPLCRRPGQAAAMPEAPADE